MTLNLFITTDDDHVGKLLVIEEAGLSLNIVAYRNRSRRDMPFHPFKGFYWAYPPCRLYTCLPWTTQVGHGSHGSSPYRLSAGLNPGS